MRGRFVAVTALAAALLLLLAGPVQASIPSWTTYHHDAQRSGIDPDSLSPLPPSRLWQTPALDGDIYGQPLVYGSRVYVATENDTVYALDAATGAIVWQRHLATPVSAGSLPCGDISPVVGITSTPVIDPASNALYVVADSADAGIQHKLFGLSLTDGSLTAGLPTVVDPPGSVPANQLQRPALALDGGRVIVGYGGNAGDCASYHGWLVAAAQNGAGTPLAFEVDQHGNGGAIWSAGNGPPVDGSGNIWTSTGNGSSSLGFEYQESVLKLGATLGLADWWAPSDWSALDSSDADLGSSDPLLLPGGLVFEIGKQGIGYLLSASSLGHTGAAPRFEASVCNGSYGGGIYAGGVIYVACSDGLRALSLNTSGPSFAALGGWTVNSHAIGPPVLAGGLVWSAGWNNGVLYGLVPGSGATAFSASLGSFHHFTSPSAGGGRLFVANGSEVTALTIATPPSGASPPPPGLAAAAPVVSHIRVRLHRGKVTLLLTLSERARVTVVIRRLEPGRRVRGRCRAGAKAGRRCVAAVKRATISLAGSRGSNTFKLRLRPLARGLYTATVRARDAGGRRSSLHVIRFRVRLSG